MQAELPLLADLAGMTADELYRQVAELLRRGLVQRRGRCRAVLPQALALRLARLALQDFPLNRIETTMRRRADGRLLRSFSRRIGYLHDSEEAQELVGRWLSSDGFMADLGKLNQIDYEIFRNIAPVLPDLTLAKINQAISTGSIDLTERYSSSHATWTSILKSLAYEAKHFDRAAMALVGFIRNEEPQRNHSNSARDLFLQLFQILFSGTHAPIQQRLNILNQLMTSDCDKAQNLVVDALDRLLMAAHFSSFSSFDFGARSRDYGWQPHNTEEVKNWYRAVIAFAQPLASANNKLSAKTRNLLANRFYELWIYSGIQDELESMAKSVAANKFWPEGWIATRKTIGLCRKSKKSKPQKQLIELEKSLRPVDPVQFARAYIFSQPWGSLDIVDDELDSDDSSVEEYEKRMERAQIIIENLGQEIVKEPEMFDALLPDIVSHTAHPGVVFGRGWR